MWPFTSPKKQTDDVELTPDIKIVQTSIDPTVLPYLEPEPEPDDIQSQQLRPAYQRLGIHPIVRYTAFGGVAGAAGFLKGVKVGADVATLCYRAENAHLTPTSKAGWYLYNKSKNYHALIGGVKQGVKTGIVYLGWTSLFLTLEGGLDAARGRVFASRKEKENGELRRGQTDFLNTVSAAVAVAGIHSWWSGMDRFSASRMTRLAVRFSVPFGLGQDALAWMKGENTWYVEGIYRLLGYRNDDSVRKLEMKQI